MSVDVANIEEITTGADISRSIVRDYGNHIFLFIIA